MRLVESDYVMDERLVNYGGVCTFLVAWADEEVGFLHHNVVKREKHKTDAYFY